MYPGLVNHFDDMKNSRPVEAQALTKALSGVTSAVKMPRRARNTRGAGALDLALVATHIVDFTICHPCHPFFPRLPFTFPFFYRFPVAMKRGGICSACSFCSQSDLQ